MESAQLISEEWDSLSGQYTAEEADFMAQFLGCSGNTSFAMPSYFPSSNGTHSCDLGTNIDSLSMFFSMEDAKFSPQYLDHNLTKKINYECINHEGPGLVLVENNLRDEREHEMMMTSEEDKSKNLGNPAKRFRSSLEVSENIRNVRKCPKSGSMSHNEEGLTWHGSNNCFPQVNSNPFLEQNGGKPSILSLKEPEAPKLRKKSKAGSGPATDAQSIYARRRRERINERLRILQTLVPNGTKVDISTMLEEAVQYVKFLQLQIKLLSSEDMWMYAPIAYNGINIGLDLSFSSPTKLGR